MPMKNVTETPTMNHFGLIAKVADMANRRKARVYNISELNELDELTPKKKKTKFLSYKVRRPFSMY